MPKSIKTRIQNKHDIEANWLQATGFVPLAGELIIYDPDDTHKIPRIKIGDGETLVGQLDFIDSNCATAEELEALVEDLSKKADKEHGTHVTFSDTNPVISGTASAGTATTVARSDHKHPTDTTRAAQADLAAHTADNTTHITADERTSWNAAYTHSNAAHAPSNAEKNQNAFSNVTVGSITIAADTTTDTLTLVAGSNVIITPDANNDKITIAATDTTYSTGTAATAGITKLYNATGSGTDGTMTQSAITSAIDNLISCGTADPSAATTSKFYFKYSTD